MPKQTMDRMRVRTGLWSALILGFALAVTGRAGAGSPPNILLCMADDWGWPHAGAYGDAGVKTVTFDRIAREGVLFHHTYVSSPSCTPSRNAVITGKYHWQLGPGANLHSTLPVEHESFVHLLRDHGYVTGRDKPKTWGPGRIQSWADHHGDHPVTTAYDGLPGFLEKTQAGQKPFFFWLATSDPHRGYVKGSGKRSGIDPAKAHLFEHFPDVPEIRSDVADYYYEVQRWDAKVGKALALLEKNGLLENTVVIMTGDHGMPFPRGKGNLYDSGVRVPFAVRWGAGIEPGREVEDFVSFADIAPTLLELAGIPVPEAMTGQSVVSLLTASGSGRLAADERPDIVFGRERHVPAQEIPDFGGFPSRAVRTPEFLYIRNYRSDRWPMGTPNYENSFFGSQWYSDCDGGPTKSHIVANRDRDDAHRRAYALCFGRRPAEELYDLARDPGQVHNVAEQSAYAEPLRRLRNRLDQRLTALGDPRGKEPHYDGFDDHPYYGAGGGKVPRDLVDADRRKEGRRLEAAFRDAPNPARGPQLRRAGRPVVDLLYVCDESGLRVPPPPPGYDSDCIRPEALMELHAIRNLLVDPSGVRYRMLVLSSMDSVPPSVLRKLEELVNTGVVVVGNRPTGVAGTDTDPRVEAVVEELWNDEGPRVHDPDMLAELLKKNKLLPDLEVADPEGIDWLHRTSRGVEIYRVSNRHAEPRTVRGLFRVGERRPELWHPESGAITPAAVWRPNGNQRTEVTLELDGSESVFVVFREPAGKTPSNAPSR